MSNYYQTGLVMPATRRPYKLFAAIATAILTIATAAVTLNTNAHALSAGNCNFDDSVAGTWSLTADCVSTAQINVPANTVLEGNGHTISASFAKTDNSNNAVLGVLNNNVTVRNLTIDGSGGTNLHGINTYQVTGIVVDHVTLKDVNRIGINVNGSTVTVSNTTTSGSGWSAIDVDQGSGVTTPAVLNLSNGNHHSEAVQVYVDDTTKNVTVNDLFNNYNLTVNPVGGGENDALYTLKPVVLANKDACKNGGWTTSQTPVFKNQGQCVSYFAKNK